MPQQLIQKVRNISYAPYLEKEGVLICPMPQPPKQEPGKIWYHNLNPHDRLFYHHTLCSVRASKRFLPTPLIPRDSLDFQLQSRYDHSKEMFPERVDSVLQKESCAHTKSTAVDTFRVLRNEKTLKIKQAEVLGHPLKIGGIKEKISKHSVKLINSGTHTQLVNNGFSRQPADGNFFRY